MTHPAAAPTLTSAPPAGTPAADDPGSLSGSTGVSRPHGAAAPPWRRRRWLLKAGFCAAVVIGLLAWAPFADDDDLGNIWAFLRSLINGMGSVRWQLVPLVGTLAVLHYVLAAVVLRAGAGMSLPLREVVLVQFAAAAANRLTPPGVGAVAVNARYLARRSRQVPEAVGLVAAINVLGAFADGLLLLAVLGVAWASGAGDPTFAAVGSKAAGLASLISPRSHPVVWIAVLAAVLVVMCWIVLRRRIVGRPGDRGDRGDAGRRPGAGLGVRAPALVLRRSLAAAAQIRRRPRDLVTLLVASAGTTLALAVAFTISLMATPHGPAADRFTILLVAYLIGAAAGSAAPTPAGMGSTETALTALLLAAHVGAAPAVQAVLLFRALTFWAPVPIGIIAAGRLRRRAAL